MFKRINEKLTLPLVGIVSTMPRFSFAEDVVLPENDDIEVVDVITKVTTWLTNLVAVIAVLFLIYGGLIYITSAGNKDRAESAKKTITYAVIGLLFVVLAKVIVALVFNTGDVFDASNN